MKELIILPIETKSREFLAKLNLASFLLNNDHDVLIGSRKGILRELSSYSNFIYISKSLSYELESTIAKVKSLNSTFIVLDEEGNVFHENENTVIKSILPLKYLDKIDYYFACGKKISELIKLNYPHFDQAKVKVVGNPRFELLKKNYDTLFTKTDFNNYILINTNFSLGNPQKGLIAQKDYIKKHVDFTPDFKAHLLDKINTQLTLVKEYCTMIEHLALIFPNELFIVRPHPSEDVKYWKKVYRV